MENITKSKILFFFCLSFIAGVFWDSIAAFPYFLFLILGLILIFVLWKHKKAVIIGFCLVFLVLGAWRYHAREMEISNNELRKYNDLGYDTALIGTIVEEPDIRDNSQKLTVRLEGIKGKVLVSYKSYPKYKYGDKIKVVGEFKTPPVFEDFNYKDYLAKSGIYSVVYWSEIELLEKNSGLAFYAKILGFKDKLRQSIYKNLSFPQSSILGAMILGDKSKMPDSLKEKLNIAGVRHITAVSGMHIAIISSLLMSLLIGLGFWRGQAFYISIIIILLFVIMIGAQPSSVRAGLMGGLYLLGQKVGRKSFSSRSLVMAGAFMLAMNPLLLLGDVGFQLSFLAVMGIIYFKDSLGKIFKSDVISMTLSAQIFTLPILVYNFGRISLIAPLTNVLILPIIPFIMALGFILAISGTIGIGWFFSFLVWPLLAYLLKIVDLLSQPWLARTFENVHWLWLISCYVILGYLAYYLNKYIRKAYRF